ncbi:helix-turn-helix transcriptional regulator [Pedobacter cryoconitis]|uniref:Putative DNA-binding transcriptional regulator YafY n=1 Tax=Pedobacter cryoconitis TaxID=188932 RepID=A0A7X0MKY9_9SPHI|nr:YafY family protein [Pedobacter cryoconitis]MBB6501245.1 putative DNA-binding transcriptional regulator YafY [Pedobacter cryoconitis]
MSNNTDIKRLTRLSAILLQLQTKKIVNSTGLAEKFAVSVRTIYRDIKVLEQIGVPIASLEGKGYSLAEGYKIPPVMFTEQEANALITAGQLINLNKDSSLITCYKDAVDKVKAVLSYTAKDKVELLSKRVAVSPASLKQSTSNSLSSIQNALTSFTVLRITYQAEGKNESIERFIEPFAFYYSLQQHWTLIAFCRLRNDFRMFRLDRIITVYPTDLKFPPHQLSLQEYLQEKEKNFISPDKQLS